MAKVLPEYVSESSSDEEVAQSQVHARNFANYGFKSNFGSRDEAENEFVSEKSWRQRRTVSLEGDRRIYYNCKWSRKCPVKMMLIIPHSCSDVSQHVSDASHNHELKQPGLPDDIKEAVSELFQVGVTKPNAILSALRAKGVTPPKKKKLQHYLTKLRSDQSKNKHVYFKGCLKALPQN